MATSLRQTLKDSLLGYSNSKSLIDETQLPLKRVILKKLLFFRENDVFISTREICARVFHDELKPLWAKACIPVTYDTTVIKKMKALWDSYLSVKQIAMDRKNRGERICAFISEISLLFDISPIDVFEKMRSLRSKHWREDYQFLEGQRKNPQVGGMGALHQISLKEKANLNLRKFVLPENEEPINLLPPMSPIENTDDESDGDQSEEYLGRREPKSDTINLQIPRDLSKATSTVCDGRNLSVRYQEAFTREFFSV